IGFSVHVDQDVRLSGRPRLVLVDRLETRRGNGLPRAIVQVALRDCGPAGCTTLSSGSADVVRSHDDWVSQTVPMSRLDATVPAGHTLRVDVAIVSHDNVTGLLVGFGGATASRLLLG